MSTCNLSGVRGNGDLVDPGSLMPCVLSLLLQPQQYHSEVKGIACVT